MSTTEVLPKGWSEKPLGDLLSFQNGANADGSAYGRGVKFANVLEVLENSHLTAKQIPGMVSVPKSVIQSFRLLRGDVLFNRTSETQDEVALASVYLDDSEAIFGGFVIRGRPKTNELDPVWSGYGLRANRVRTQIIAVSQGAVRANIGQENLGKVVAWLPPPEEQRAIAGVLSNVDTLIDSLDALIAKKRNLKQAAMQQLLSGKRRLPGFSGEWSEVTLKTFGCCHRGVSFNPNVDIRPANSIGAFCLLRANNVKGDKLDISDVYWIGQCRVSETQILQAGDILICMANGSRRLVGKSAVVPESPLPLTFGAFMATFRPDHDQCGEFVRWLFQSPAYQRELDIVLSGSSINNLRPTHVEGVPVSVPDDPSEQTAIAEVLSNMDAELDALIARRDKSALLRTGLMQELLSGRRRLV